jgi:hypothetical protein
LSVLYWGLVSLIFCIVVLQSKVIDETVVVYFILFVIGVSINFLSKERINGVLLIPIFSYMCFYIQKHNSYRDALYLFSKIIIVFLIIFSLIELFVKLNFVQLPWMYVYLKDSGAKRIDVLRLRGPFGSPLSLSTTAVYLFFYSLYIHRDLLCFYGSIFIVLMSGSRTAFIICFMMVLSTFLLRKISVKKLIYSLFVAVIMICVVFYSADRLGLTNILDRVISFKSYDITRDESFLGRNNTTVYTARLIFERIPRTLFFPFDAQYISDSAIVSLIAGSGLFLVMNFIIFLLKKIIYLRINHRIKLLFGFLIFLLAFMVGDAFVPAASFYLCSILYYNKTS